MPAIYNKQKSNDCFCNYSLFAQQSCELGNNPLRRQFLPVWDSEAPAADLYLARICPRRARLQGTNDVTKNQLPVYEHLLVVAVA